MKKTHDMGKQQWQQQAAGALRDSLVMLSPRHQLRNPVMFIVYLGAILLLLLFFHVLTVHPAEAVFTGAIDFWLWITILFANFAEAVAERQDHRRVGGNGRGRNRRRWGRGRL